MSYNILCFYWEDLLKLRPTLKLEDHHLSAVRDCLFSIFANTLHIGGRSSIFNLRTRHAVATGTHLSSLHILAAMKDSSWKLWTRVYEMRLSR
jgi:hypothetical protein